MCAHVPNTDSPAVAQSVLGQQQDARPSFRHRPAPPDLTPRPTREAQLQSPSARRVENERQRNAAFDDSVVHPAALAVLLLSSPQTCLCVCPCVWGGVFVCVFFLVVGYPFPQAHSFPVQPCAKEIAMLGGLVRVGRETGAREACMCTLAC